MEKTNVIECRVLTTADIAKVFIHHVDTHKHNDLERNDYFDFARAIEIEVLKKVQEK